MVIRRGVEILEYSQVIRRSDGYDEGVRSRKHHFLVSPSTGGGSEVDYTAISVADTLEYGVADGPLSVHEYFLRESEGH